MHIQQVRRNGVSRPSTVDKSWASGDRSQPYVIVPASRTPFFTCGSPQPKSLDTCPATRVTGAIDCGYLAR